MKEKVYPCPCCGYLVHDEPPGMFDICPICFWEDDAIYRDPLLSSGGANKVSLLEGQQNYLTFGACEERIRDDVRPPLPSEKRAAGWRPIDPSIDILDKILKDPTYQAIVHRSFLKDHSSVYYWRSTYWQRTLSSQESLPQQQRLSSDKGTK